MLGPASNPIKVKVALRDIDQKDSLTSSKTLELYLRNKGLKEVQSVSKKVEGSTFLPSFGHDFGHAWTEVHDRNFIDFSVQFRSCISVQAGPK